MYLTPVTRDRVVAQDWLARFEGAGLDGVIAKPTCGALSARQAGDDKGEARADGRVRRGRIPLAQERQGCGGFAVTRAVRCERALQHVGVTSSFTMADAEATGEGTGATPQERNGRSSLARVGGSRGRIEPHAGRAEPLERR